MRTRPHTLSELYTVLADPTRLSTTRPTSLRPTTRPHTSRLKKSLMCYVQVTSGPVVDRIVLILDEEAPKDRIRCLGDSLYF